MTLVLVVAGIDEPDRISEPAIPFRGGRCYNSTAAALRHAWL
jgi:hypothetical protein